MTKLKNSKSNITQKIQFWQNSKTYFVTKLNNLNCYKTQNIKLWQSSKLKMWQNSKTPIVTKLKNSNCNKTQKLKLWQHSKTQILINSKTQIVTKLKNSNCDKTKKPKLWQNSKSSNSDTLTTNEMFLGQLLQFSQCFYQIRCSRAVLQTPLSLIHSFTESSFVKISSKQSNSHTVRARDKWTPVV